MADPLLQQQNGMGYPRGPMISPRLMSPPFAAGMQPPFHPGSTGLLPPRAPVTPRAEAESDPVAPPGSDLDHRVAKVNQLLDCLNESRECLDRARALERAESLIKERGEAILFLSPADRSAALVQSMRKAGMTQDKEPAGSSDLLAVSPLSEGSPRPIPPPESIPAPPTPPPDAAPFSTPVKKDEPPSMPTNSPAYQLAAGIAARLRRFGGSVDRISSPADLGGLPMGGCSGLLPPAGLPMGAPMPGAPQGAPPGPQACMPRSEAAHREAQQHAMAQVGAAIEKMESGHMEGSVPTPTLLQQLQQPRVPGVRSPEQELHNAVRLLEHHEEHEQALHHKAMIEERARLNAVAELEQHDLQQRRAVEEDRSRAMHMSGHMYGVHPDGGPIHVYQPPSSWQHRPMAAQLPPPGTPMGPLHSNPSLSPRESSAVRNFEHTYCTMSPRPEHNDRSASRSPKTTHTASSFHSAPQKSVSPKLDLSSTDALRTGANGEASSIGDFQLADGDTFQAEQMLRAFQAEKPKVVSMDELRVELEKEAANRREVQVEEEQRQRGLTQERRNAADNQIDEILAQQKSLEASQKSFEASQEKELALRMKQLKAQQEAVQHFDHEWKQEKEALLQAWREDHARLTQMIMHTAPKLETPLPEQEGSSVSKAAAHTPLHPAPTAQPRPDHGHPPLPQPSPAKPFISEPRISSSPATTSPPKSANLGQALQGPSISPLSHSRPRRRATRSLSLEPGLSPRPPPSFSSPDSSGASKPAAVPSAAPTLGESSHAAPVIAASVNSSAAPNTGHLLKKVDNNGDCVIDAQEFNKAMHDPTIVPEAVQIKQQIGDKCWVSKVDKKSGKRYYFTSTEKKPQWNTPAGWKQVAEAPRNIPKKNTPSPKQSDQTAKPLQKGVVPMSSPHEAPVDSSPVNLPTARPPRSNAKRPGTESNAASPGGPMDK